MYVAQMHLSPDFEWHMSFASLLAGAAVGGEQVCFAHAVRRWLPLVSHCLIAVFVQFRWLS